MKNHAQQLGTTKVSESDDFRCIWKLTTYLSVPVCSGRFTDSR